MALPRREDFRTVQEFVDAMQLFYADRNTVRMRDRIPTTFIMDEWSTDRTDWWGGPKKPKEELALVVAIKEEIKEAELLGWKVDQISIDPALLDWLVSRRPVGLERDDYSFCWRLSGHELLSNEMCSDDDGVHSRFFLSGSHPQHGTMACIACTKEREDSE